MESVQIGPNDGAVDFLVSGRLIRTARLRSEFYVPAGDPSVLVGQLTDSGRQADIFTFVQDIHDRDPKHHFQMERHSMAVLPLTTYEEWFNHQINFKPRNKLRKCRKSGLEIREVEFSDDLVRGIVRVYDETPIRQGKRNWHYGKDFETVKREHATFLDRSQFIGALYQGELVGFVKLTHVKGSSFLMNIVAMNRHRDKATTNGLLAKAIEICTSRTIRYLVYGIWGRRGLNDFKVANGFQRFEVPRYFVPITQKGRLALRLRLHRKPVEYLPESAISLCAAMRSKWYEFRFRSDIPKAAGRGAADAAR